MTIEQLGSVGELVGALATVATLLYLAVQIRQNTVQTGSESLPKRPPLGVERRRTSLNNAGVPVSLETLGDLGDFVGGFAVVISLVYLAFQIRQNTGQVRQSLQVARAQALRETVSTGWTFEVARDPALATLYSRGLQQPEQLTDDERVRLLFLMGTIFGEIEKNYLMYEQALLTPERWEAQLVTLRFHVKQPGGVYYWERFSNTHTRAFIQIVDRQRAGRSSTPVPGKGSE